MNKRLTITVLFLCTIALLSAQPFWQIDFKNLSDDVKKGFQLKGSCAITAEGFVTDTVTGKDHAIATIPTPLKEIPDGLDGKLLRVSWTFIPQKIGGWGNDFRINPNMVV